jgi:hypothetical protein
MREHIRKWNFNCVWRNKMSEIDRIKELKLPPFKKVTIEDVPVGCLLIYNCNEGDTPLTFGYSPDSIFSQPPQIIKARDLDGSWPTRGRASAWFLEGDDVPDLMQEAFSNNFSDDFCKSRELILNYRTGKSQYGFFIRTVLKEK